MTIKRNNIPKSLIFLVSIITTSYASGNTYIVTGTYDNGEGSLSQCIIQANMHPGADTIKFNIPRGDPGFNGNVWIISPSSTLSLTDDNTLIDGYTQTLFSGDTNPEGPEIEISFSGTVFNIRSSNNEINDLIINGFKDSGIRITGNNNKISDNYICTNSAGDQGNCDSFGVEIRDGGSNNRILSNLIAGTTVAAVYITGEDANNNIIEGNNVGVKKDGLDIITGGNIGNGIFVLSNIVTYVGPKHNLIKENTVAGFQWGIYMAGPGTEYNTVENNYVGINKGGVILGNEDAGIHLCDGAKYNIVEGNTVAGAGESDNVFFDSGINTHGRASQSNKITGNTVHSNYYGISLTGGTSDNEVSGNTVQNNEVHGIRIRELHGQNIIKENEITDNALDGVHIEGTNNGIVISQNSITNNVGEGIVSSITSPKIIGNNDNVLYGTSSSNAIIEIFSDSEDEGERYLGETLSDSIGRFTFDISNTGAYGFATATATLEDDCTSGFSAPLQISLSIISTSLAKGWKGIAYSETLSCIGGIPPYVWSLYAGSLPLGLSLDWKGTIFGTPNEMGTADFTVQASDKEGATATRSLSITVYSCTGGDVNNDGNIDLLDLVRVVNMILETAGSPTQYEECAADCNQDGDVNVLDSVGIANVILGIGECEP